MSIELAEIETTPAAPMIDDVVTDPPGGWGYQSLLIRQIRRDGGTQARVGLNEDTVTEYTELMRDHLWDFQSRQRPIVLYDGAVFWLADGFHRIEAAQRAQLSDFPVEVLRGNQRDAILRAAGANSQHGLRRTNADKRRAVELLLKDTEWRQWSDRKIADVCAVGNKFVGDVRRDLSVSGTQMPEMRTVERNGNTYQMTPAAPKSVAGAINRPNGEPLNDVPPPDLSPYGYSARVLPDGRIAIHTPGNLESQHTAGQLNDLLQFWRSCPPIPADMAAVGVAWRYRSDRMYQVMHGNSIGHTGYTAQECLDSQREALVRYGLLAPTATPAAEVIDDQAKQAQIRDLTDAYGLQVVWDDDKVQIYWPEEVEDLEQMDLLPYDVAIEWLTNEAPGLAERRNAAPADHTVSDREAYEAAEELDLILIGKAEKEIASGDLDCARDLLSQVQVATYRRDQLLARIGDMPQMIALPPFPAKNAPALMDSIAFLLEMIAEWVPSSRERAAPALGLLRAIGRKTLEATETLSPQSS